MVPVEALGIAARQLSELKARPCSAPRTPRHDDPDAAKCWFDKGLSVDPWRRRAPTRGGSAAGLDG
jgi:hypothetical protein